MNDNFYAPPEAFVADVELAAARPPLYVVSPRKLGLLMLGTCGLYSLFWNYRNWKNWRDAIGEPVWALPRTLFSWFFTHALFRRVREQAERQGITLAWRNGLHATLLVITMLLAAFVPWVAAESIGLRASYILPYLLLIPELLLMLQAQKQINLACGDAGGLGNDALSAANYIWLAIGLINWVTGLNMIFAPVRQG